MPHRMFVSVEFEGDGPDQPDHKSATKAIELLDQHREHPFFLAVGLVRPHYPMVAPRQYFATYAWQNMTLPDGPVDDLMDIPKLGLAGTLSNKNPIGNYPDNQKRMWTAYYASVSYMDSQVGRILDHLDKLGLRENTAIVFTSDHGYHLGEHTFWQKSNLHEEVARVPLIISVPRFNPGRSASLVELVDLYPTLAQLAGLDIPSQVQGVSLVPVLEDPKVEVKAGALSLENGIALRTARWHYMHYNDGSLELYDMQSDPHQFINLAQLPEVSSTLRQLEAQLQERIALHGLDVLQPPKAKKRAKQ